jgi:uncharacterized protein (TIGR00251 family)
MKDSELLNIRDVARGAAIVVKVVPGASRDRVVGVLGDALKITTAAAAEKGRANAAVARTLAGALGVRQREVDLVSGRTSQQKVFRVAGVTAVTLRKLLQEL